MERPLGLRRRDLRVLLPLLFGAVVALTPRVGPARAVDPESGRPLAPEVCARLVEAFEGLQEESLRGVLALGEVQVAITGPRGARPREERRLSVEQVIVLLRESLGTEERAAVEGLGPDAVLAPRASVGCHCPEVGESGDDAFLVLHFGRPPDGGAPRRLYLDLRRDASGWRVRALRELR